MGIHTRKPDKENKMVGIRVIAICFLCQNLANGIGYSSFGALLLATEQRFDVPRHVSSSGMSAIILSFAILSPVVGILLQRYSVRLMMSVGAGLNGIGYVILAYAPAFWVAFAGYVLIGIGMAFLAESGPLLLMTRWFSSNRAKALGIVNLPIVSLSIPMIIYKMMALGYDRETILMILAGAFFLLIAPILFLVERPEDLGRKVGGLKAASLQATSDEIIPIRMIIATPQFWLICMGVGCIAGSGVTFVVHFIAFAVERGVDPQDAAATFSAFGLAGLIGNMVFGALADRYGPVKGLLMIDFIAAIMWAALALASPEMIRPSVILLGLCFVPNLTLYGVALSHLFGSSGVSKAYGLGYIIKLPFMFVFAPLAGYIFDRTGDYKLAFLLMAFFAVLAGVGISLVLGIRHKESRRSAKINAPSRPEREISSINGPGKSA